MENGSIPFVAADDPQDIILELMDIELGGVDDPGCHLAQTGKPLPLDADTVDHRAMFVGRMPTAGLRKSPHQCFIQGIEKKDLDAVARCRIF